MHLINKKSILPICGGILVLILCAVLVWQYCRLSPSSSENQKKDMEYDIVEARVFIPYYYAPGRDGSDYTNLENPYVRRFLTQFESSVQKTWFKDSIACTVEADRGDPADYVNNSDEITLYGMGEHEFYKEWFEFDIPSKFTYYENVIPYTFQLGRGATYVGYMQGESKLMILSRFP